VSERSWLKEWFFASERDKGAPDRFCRHIVPGRRLLPQAGEGFAFASLTSLLNLSSALSNNLGSFL